MVVEKVHHGKTPVGGLRRPFNDPRLRIGARGKGHHADGQHSDRKSCGKAWVSRKLRLAGSPGSPPPSSFTPGQRIRTAFGRPPGGA